MLFFTSLSIFLSILALPWISTNSAIIAPKVTKKQPTAESVIKAAEKPTGVVCTTATCKAIAKKFLDRINAKINPCDDFYEYSCGKLIASQKEYDVDEFSKLAVQSRNVGKDLFKGKIKPKGKTFDAEVKVKSLHTQCMNQAAIEKLRGTQIIRILDEYLGGWPLISPKWNAATFNPVESLVNSYYFKSTSLFTITVEQDMENPSRYLIDLEGPELVIAPDLLQNKDTVLGQLDAYSEAIHTVANKLLRDANQTSNITQQNEDVSDIVQMENYLGSNMLTTRETKNTSIYLNKMSLRDFKARSRFNSSLLRNITGVLQSFFAPANLSHAITDDTVIVLPSLHYFPKLDQKLVELEKQGAKGRRRLAVYIGWKLIYSVLNYLSREYRAATLGFDSDASVEDYCFDMVKTVMPLAVGAMYVRDTVPNDLKGKAALMVSDIRQGFRALLEEATWMDNATHQEALQKLAAMKQIVAYPDFMANNMSVIDSQYKMMAVEGTLIRSVLQTNKNNFIQQMKELTKTRVLYDPVRDKVDVMEANAQYDPFQNQLAIMAGILRIPFFEANAPQYLNYGGIGFVIGHEISHGFDNTGANFDSVGLRRIWWTKKTLDAFNSRGSDLVEQYSQYAVPSGKLNGALTSTENIADNGGLRAALKGYTRYLQRLTTPEAVLPGMEKFTPLQLFFLSAAQGWCDKQSPEIEIQQLMDEHPPKKWRVNGAVSNIPEFAQSFKCSIGSKMNPAVKNRVW